MSCHDFRFAFLPQAGGLYILSLSPPRQEPRAAKQGRNGLHQVAPHTPNHHKRMWGGKWTKQEKEQQKKGNGSQKQSNDKLSATKGRKGGKRRISAPPLGVPQAAKSTATTEARGKKRENEEFTATRGRRILKKEVSTPPLPKGSIKPQVGVVLPRVRL